MKRWSLRLALGDALVAWLGLPIGIVLAGLLFSILCTIAVPETIQYFAPLAFLLVYCSFIIYARFRWKDTLEGMIQTRDWRWWLLGIVSCTSLIVTWRFRQCPWLTALSILGLASLCVVGATRRLTQSPRKLWGALLVLALILYFGSLGYQAGNSGTQTRYLAWAQLPLPDNPGHFLAIAYPRIVPVEAPDEPGSLLSAYIWPSELVVTPTPTATKAPVIQTTIPSTAIPSPTFVTVTPIPNLTARLTQTVSYTVGFAPYNDGLLFTNEKSVPVAPRLLVRSDQPPDKPTVLFLHRALTRTVPATVPLTAYLYDPNGIQQGHTSFEVQLEDTYGAWWRHFFDLVLGPTTPLLALAAALVGFGWQWWQEGQKRRELKLEDFKGIEILAAQDKLEEARQALGEVTIKYRAEPEFQTELEKAQNSVRLAKIRHVKKLVFTDRKQALAEFEQLQRERGEEEWNDPTVIAALEQLRDADLGGQGRRLLWPKSLPDKRPPDAPAIGEWREQVGLKFNPFSPERAEEDPRLLELIVEPPGWELLKAPEPTVIFGADGSGRTASRLFLAHTCTTTKLAHDRANRRPFDTLAVSFFIFPGGNPAEAAADCWRTLTHALARAPLDFLACNPGVFSETPADHQRALARLFTMHRHSLGDPAGYLLGAGLDRSIALHLGDSIRQATRGTRPPSFTDNAELLSILAQARLLPFKQSYILVEVPDQVPTWFRPKEIASHMNALLHIMPSLAARGIYIKLFIPEDVKPQLQTLPSCVDKIELSWDETALQKMLEQRVQRAGATTFRNLFARVPRGANPTTRLAQAASASEGPPRRLIQLGQELLIEHIHRSPNDPRLRWEELDAVMERAAQGEIP